MAGSVKKQIDNVDWENPDSIIEFYENNLLYFNNYDNVTNKESIIEYIDLKLHYCNSLFEKSRFKKALPILSHIDLLLKKIDENEEKYEDYSVHALYLKGLIQGNLKNAKNSYEIFSKLIEIDPDNDIYKRWFLLTKTHLYTKPAQVISYIGFGIIIIDLIGGHAFNIEMNRYITIAGLAMAFGGGTFPFFRKHWINLKEKIK